MLTPSSAKEHSRMFLFIREKGLTTRLWIETHKLWIILGPSIINRLASYSMNVITQAFAGHLGDVELAAISIANTVIVGFNFGLLVINQSLPLLSLSLKSKNFFFFLSVYNIYL